MISSIAKRPDAWRASANSPFAAAREAIADAQLDLETLDRSRIGVVLGNGAGGYPEIQATASTLFDRGGMRLDPLFLPKVLPNMAAANIAMQFGLLGYNTTVVTACAAGTQALGDAANVIRNGLADIVISGGAEAGFCQLGLGGFAVMRALSSRNDEPTAASRPFDADRDGFVPGEGAGIIVLESEESARRRGIDYQVELAGFGSSADAHHLVMPDADGAGPIRAINWALQDAAIEPDQLDYVNAHGTSTPLNDASETRALKVALGDAANHIPISSTKSMIGHIFGGAGGLESIAAIKSIIDGRNPPDDQLHHARSRLRSRLRAQRKPVRDRQRGPQELIRLRRPKRLPRLPTRGVKNASAPRSRRCSARREIGPLQRIHWN